MKHYFRHLVMAILFLLLNASLVLGASVTVTSSGDGVFIIQGSSMDGVAGIDLIVNYDNSSLASPKVTQGNLISGSALLVSNPNFTSSSVKIAVVSTTALSGSGRIAMITFASHTGTGSVSVTSSMVNNKAAAVSGNGTSSATDFQTATTDSSSSATTATTTSSTTSSTSTSAISSSLGSVSVPSEVQTGRNMRAPDVTDQPAQSSGSDATRTMGMPAERGPVSVPQMPEKTGTTSYKGTLENFRAYTGKKTPANLIALFNKKIAPTIHQEPTIALSNGKTVVKILANIGTNAGKLPNFALNGAKLISLKRDGSSWVIEVLPQTNSVQANLTILTDSYCIEYPLTLAPPIKGISHVKADFAAFLKDSGAAHPKRDLNGDGKHDYKDDFIYTANYLTGTMVKDK